MSWDEHLDFHHTDTVIKDTAKRKRVKLFDWLKSINSSKDVTMFNDDTKSDYEPFIINKALGTCIDVIMDVAELNKFDLNDLPKKYHYLYLVHGIDKAYRKIEFVQKDVDRQDTIKAIKHYYDYNEVRAIEVLHVLTVDQISAILVDYEEYKKRYT